MITIDLQSIIIAIVAFWLLRLAIDIAFDYWERWRKR